MFAWEIREKLLEVYSKHGSSLSMLILGNIENKYSKILIFYKNLANNSLKILSRWN